MCNTSLTWQWHPFYLSKKGHFSISLVDSKHSVIILVWVCESQSLLLCGFLRSLTQGTLLCLVLLLLIPSLIFFFFLLISLMHSFLLSSFGTFQKMPHLSSHAILLSHFGFSHLSLNGCSLFRMKSFFLKKKMFKVFFFFTIASSLSPLSPLT